MSKTAIRGNEFGKFRRAFPDADVPRGLQGELGKAERFLTARESEERAAMAKAKGEVEATLGQAGRALRLMPWPRELRALAGGNGSMPAPIREFADLVGNETEMKHRARTGVGGSTRADTDAFDLVISWLYRLPADERHAVMGKLMHCGFRRIAAADPERRSYRTWQRIYQRALGLIVGGLLAGNLR